MCNSSWQGFNSETIPGESFTWGMYLNLTILFFTHFSTENFPCHSSLSRQLWHKEFELFTILYLTKYSA